MWYSRLLVRHHWYILAFVVFICIILTITGIIFTQLPDFSDPRIGWGARGKGTIFSQLMVLRHASEKFRLAYELPLDNHELFGQFKQYLNVTVDKLDETSYRSDVLAKYDLWRNKHGSNNDYDQLIDYESLKDSFYDIDHDDNDMPEYDTDNSSEHSESSLLYQWHRERHFNVKDAIFKYVDDQIINITVMDFVKSLPQFDKTNYQSNRLPFDLFRPYAYLLEEKYRGRAGREGMIEFYIERQQPSDDLLSMQHLNSICEWEHKFKHILSLNHVPSLSLATFVALYSSKNDCRLIASGDIEHFRSILHTCLPYYVTGYMDIPLSDRFLNRIRSEHQPGQYTYQEQIKAIYTALRHTCFYKNITRFIFDHFLDKQFLNDFQHSKLDAKLSSSMIFISNYKIVPYNRLRDQTMCLRRQPYSRKYCRERGCIDDYKNNFIDKSCISHGPPFGDCNKYCQCKYECLNTTEQVILLTAILKEQELVELFEKYFSGKSQIEQYKDEFIKLIALNLANVREKAAMAQIHIDIFLVLIAAVLIVGITVLYLRSITIALMIVIGVILSIGVSYFIYRVIYHIPIFPFMNLMSAFILIGIGCDDIFVFFDTWEQEKTEWLKKYLKTQKQVEGNIKDGNGLTHEYWFNLDIEMPLNETDQNGTVPLNENYGIIKFKSISHAFQARHHLNSFDNPDEIRRLLLQEDALIEIMSKTLKHAGSSMFVTSFTTAAAFFTNVLTNISFVQVFGVFTGTCILLYFVITVTAIAAFAVIYEKYITDIITESFTICSNRNLSSSKMNSAIKCCHRFTHVCGNVRNYIFGQFLPQLIMNLRYIFVILFLSIGILGVVGVFHYPKLRVPSTQKVAFFLKDHPMEIYEFIMKNQFNGYAKEEKRLFAYPPVSFIFGIRDIDDGYLFDMNDRGNLHLVPIDLHRQNTLEFFKQFINYLGTQSELFSSSYDLEKDFEAFYQLTNEGILTEKLIDDQIKLNLSKTNHVEMIKYIGNVNTSIIKNLIFLTVRRNNYKTQYDQSYDNPMNRTLYRNSWEQLNRKPNPLIVYENYLNSFNKTLENIYKQQIEHSYNLNQSNYFLNNTIRDQLAENAQRLALKTAMQCLTGAAGENNVPADFCEQQLSRQRSMSWGVLPDKPSPIDGTVQPFAVIITIRGALNRTDYDSYNAYYTKIKTFFDPYIKNHAPKHLQHAWFSSPNFAFYGIQRELLIGSYFSLVASLAIALLVLFLTSGNLFIAIYALITITFAIADTVAVFAVLKWELGIVEAIIVIMSVGLSVDFVVHFGVGYIHTDSSDITSERKKVKDIYQKPTLALNGSENKKKTYDCRLVCREYQAEREIRVVESISRVGSAVFMAAFTTFAAGFSMTISSLTAFRQMGQFLMTIMLTSWCFAMFFFLPLCAIIGPVNNFGSIPFARIRTFVKQCFRRNMNS